MEGYRCWDRGCAEQWHDPQTVPLSPAPTSATPCFAHPTSPRQPLPHHHLSRRHRFLWWWRRSRWRYIPRLQYVQPISFPYKRIKETSQFGVNFPLLCSFLVYPYIDGVVLLLFSLYNWVYSTLCRSLHWSSELGNL